MQPVESGPRYHRKHTAGRLRTAGRMCFEGQLGGPFDVVVAAAGALMNPDPVAFQELLERQVSLQSEKLR